MSAAQNTAFLDYFRNLKDELYGIRGRRDQNGVLYPDLVFYAKTGFRPYAGFIPSDYRNGGVLIPGIPNIDFFTSPGVGARPNVGYIPRKLIKPLVAPIHSVPVTPVVVPVPSVPVPVAPVVAPISSVPVTPVVAPIPSVPVTSAVEPVPKQVLNPNEEIIY